MEKSFDIHKRARENVQNLQTYINNLKNWEAEMKRKEAALNGEFEQDLPPVRSRVKKEKPAKIPKKLEKKLSSSDYGAWEKFDVQKACEEVDMEDVGPVSLDSKKSQGTKQEKLREEAQYEKERGNSFVKMEKWDEAIACYNRAIELVKDDPIYFANRGLCYLKKDSLHQAETDCTEALRMDHTYVKALIRRATVREKLGSLRAASYDLAQVLKLEPHNASVRRQLEAIKERMGTKGANAKSSPVSTPTRDSKPAVHESKPLMHESKPLMHESKPSVNESKPKIVELPDVPKVKAPKAVGEWGDESDERIMVIKPVKKPPHLRSKRALKQVPIQEIPMGTEKPGTRINITEIEDFKVQGDTNNNSSKDITPKPPTLMDTTALESFKLTTDIICNEKVSMVQPVNSVQFMSEWKNLKGNDSARSEFLSIIDPKNIPTIFANALESDVLSELLRVLHDHKHSFRDKSVSAYLKGLCSVKRFSALAMFLSGADKELLMNMLNYCKTDENLSDNEIADLKNKYEL